MSLDNSRKAGPFWLNLFLLALSWSGDGFRSKKFRVWDPVFPEIRKKIPFLVYEIIKLAASTQPTHGVESGLMAGRWVKGGLQGQGVFVIKVGI